MSKLEDRLAALIEWANLPAPVRQYNRAVPERRFLYDFAWPAVSLLVEVQGGIWGNRGGGGMGHSSPQGVMRDAEKFNLATLHGFQCLAVTEAMIIDSERAVKRNDPGMGHAIQVILVGLGLEDIEGVDYGKRVPRGRVERQAGANLLQRSDGLVDSPGGGPQPRAPKRARPPVDAEPAS